MVWWVTILNRTVVANWIDVYEAASKKGVIVVGGSARSVGAAGGYLLGGGHSPFAHYYGLAADSQYCRCIMFPWLTGQICWK